MDKKIKILNIVGARPNFMKIAPLFRVYQKNSRIESILVHTSQHSDEKMSGTFFKSLGIPNPDYVLETDKTSPLSVISSIMANLEPILNKEKPDLVVVVGDVNSTLAAAITANKCGIKLAHVEAGLRSRDRNMPEEINRILVDHLSDFLFVTEQSGLDNLKTEGVAEGRTFFVGNVMIDNLINTLSEIENSSILDKLNLKNKSYILLTLHRPKNVDSEENLRKIIKLLEKMVTTREMKVVFPMHPRTRNGLAKYRLSEEVENIENLVITEPLDYLDFVKLAKESALILTDSGGIQEEAAYLKVPTITLRDSTERPATITSGANKLYSFDEHNIDGLLEKMHASMNMDRNAIKEVPLWDGKASERIVEIIIQNFQ